MLLIPDAPRFLKGPPDTPHMRMQIRIQGRGGHQLLPMQNTGIEANPEFAQLMGRHEIGFG